MSPELFPQKIYQLGSRAFPIYAALEVTNRCNAQCAFCYVDRKKAELSTKQLFYIIDKLAGNGILHLLITGGEPFIRDDILEILDYAIKKDFFLLSVNTNGLLLNKKHIDFFALNSAAFKNVKMSIFSHVDHINDSYFKVKNSKKIILNNAVALKQAGVSVKFSMGIFNFNVNHFHTTQSYIRNLGYPLSTSPFKLIKNNRQKTQLKDSISPFFFEHYFRTLSQENLIVQVNKMKIILQSKKIRNNMCNGRMTAIMISTNGDIAPCTALKEYRMGNIFETGDINNILISSENHKKLRNIQKTDIDECRNCRFISFCKFCLGRVFMETGSLYSVDRQCCNFANALSKISKEL